MQSPSECVRGEEGQLTLRAFGGEEIVGRTMIIESVTSSDLVVLGTFPRVGLYVDTHKCTYQLVYVYHSNNVLLCREF